MRSQFIEQVQLLMDVQEIKNAERVFGKSNYMWLCSKRVTMVWISTRDEFKIRQALTKITLDQQTQVMKKLLTFLDENPNVSTLKIPEVTLRLINNIATANLVNEATFSRMHSFRNSLRRFSSFKIKPIGIGGGFLVVPAIKPRRSVTFNDQPIVYQISK